MFCMISLCYLSNTLRIMSEGFGLFPDLFFIADNHTDLFLQGASDLEL